MARLRATPARIAAGTVTTTPPKPALSERQTKEQAPLTPRKQLKSSLERNASVPPTPSPEKRAYPSLPAPRTPSNSSIPVHATAAKSLSVAALPTTPVNQTGARRRVPKSKPYEYHFEGGVHEYGRQLMKELKEATDAVRAEVARMELAKANERAANERAASERAASERATGGRAPATTGRSSKKRFSDIHKQNFAKMDSIANHYAAKRVPDSVFKTPQNPQKGVKRTKSVANLQARDEQPSPSPAKRVKVSQQTPAEAPAPPKTPAKRTTTRTAPNAAFASKTAVKNRLGADRRALPALPQPSNRTGQSSRIPQRNVKQVAEELSKISTSRHTQVAESLSKIPVTPTKTPAIRPPSNMFAPNTVAAPNFTLPAVSASAKKTLKTPSAGGFTFQAKGPGGGFKRLSNIHNFTQDRKPSIEPPRALVNDTTLVDPFALPKSKPPAPSSKKRKNMDDDGLDLVSPKPSKVTVTKTMSLKDPFASNPANSVIPSAIPTASIQEDNRPKQPHPTPRPALNNTPMPRALPLVELPDVKVTETVHLDDPFTEPHSTASATPAVLGHVSINKTKELHPLSKADLGAPIEYPGILPYPDLPGQLTGKEAELAPTTPARKKARLDPAVSEKPQPMTPTATSSKPSLFARGKAVLMKSRLNFLATPKRKAEPESARKPPPTNSKRPKWK